jgi:hypothetical protein
MDRMGQYDCQSYREITITNFIFYFLADKVKDRMSKNTSPNHKKFFIISFDTNLGMANNTLGLIDKLQSSC